MVDEDLDISIEDQEGLNKIRFIQCFVCLDYGIVIRNNYFLNFG